MLFMQKKINVSVVFDVLMCKQHNVCLRWRYFQLLYIAGQLMCLQQHIFYL